MATVQVKRSFQEPLRALVAARACYLSVLLLSATLDTVINSSGNLGHREYQYFFFPIAIGFAYTAIAALLSTRGDRVTCYCTILIDTLLLSYSIYVTGVTTSPLVPIYLVYVIGISAILSRWEGLLATLACAVNYCALVVLVARGTLGLPFGSVGPFNPGQVLLQIIGLCSAMTLVAIASSYLARRLEEQRKRADATHAEAQELREREEQLKTELTRVQQQLAVHEQVTALINDGSASLTSSLGEFIGESPVMKRVYHLIQRTAPTEATVLISGESGTGKELVARALHRHGPRHNGPFVPVNCAAIPAELLESELFGHRKGAFTGATSDTLGMFREAHGGTIFLDEVGELPLTMQVKLLRALQERCVRPVGANTDVAIDVRVVAATNRNLRAEVTAGNFREDLFYRLNVINIHLPPLRERVGDIPLLVSAVIKRLAHNGSVPSITPAAMDLLVSYSYPGNVRELENIIERAMILGSEAILPEHLSEQVRTAVAHQYQPVRETKIIVDDSIMLPINLDELLANIESKYISLALEQSGGVKTKAAELLGINFRSFRYRLQKLPHNP